MGRRTGSGRGGRQRLVSQRRCRGDAGERLRAPEAGEVYAAVIADSAELLTVADALGAEIWVASNVFAMRAEVPMDEVFTVWQAAERLNAAGIPRQQTIRRSAQLWQHHGATETAEYVAALESVGTPRIPVTPR